MNTTQSQGKMRLMKVLHIIMLSLSLLGSISLLFIHSITSKILIVLILLAYLFTLFSKSSSIRNLLKLSLSANEKNYQIIHKWNIPVSNVDRAQTKKQKINLNNTTNILSKTSKKETDFYTSLDRSLEKSAEIKNISMSIQRSMTQSNLNEKKLTQIIPKGTKQFKGLDLYQLFAEDKVSKMGSTIRKTRDQELVLVDSQSYLSDNNAKIQQSTKKKYQEFLKNVLKKQKHSIEKKYKPLSQSLKKIVKMLMVNNNSIKDKLTKIAEEYFDLKLLESKKTLSEQLNVVCLRSDQFQTPFYLFFYKMLHLGRIKDLEKGYKLKSGCNLGQLQYKMKQVVSVLQKLNQSLGIEPKLLKSPYRQDIEEFVEKYRAYVQYAQLYLDNADPSNYNFQTKETVSFRTQLAKSKAFALHLLIKQINASLKYARKIKFNDYLDFRYPSEQNIQFQINKKQGSEGPSIHYDLSVLDQGRQKMRYTCQPGVNNYLSVLYFLLLELSKKDELLTWNTYVKGLTQLIL